MSDVLNDRSVMMNADPMYTVTKLKEENERLKRENAELRATLLTDGEVWQREVNQLRAHVNALRDAAISVVEWGSSIDSHEASKDLDNLEDVARKKTPAQSLEDDQLHKVTPEIVAEMFCAMDSRQQAAFFNHVAAVSSKWDSGGFPTQLQYITDEHGLTLAGRRVMQGIGEYSHWGLCKLEAQS